MRFNPNTGEFEPERIPGRNSDPKKPGGNRSSSVILIIASLVVIWIVFANQTKVSTTYMPTETTTADSTVISMDSTFTMAIDSTMATDSVSTMSFDSTIAYNEYGTGNGKFFFWTRHGNDGTIKIYIDDVEKGQIREYFNSSYTPSCGEDGTVGVVLPVGIYKFKGVGETLTWEGSVTIREGLCDNSELTSVADSPTYMSADSAK